jgi:acyl carrier protein
MLTLLKQNYLKKCFKSHKHRRISRVYLLAAATSLYPFTTDLTMNYPTSQLGSKKSLTQAEIEVWLSSYLSQLLEIDPSEVDVNLCLERYGLDSSGAIGLISDLSDHTGYELEPILLEKYSTIAALAKYCSELEEIAI